MEAGETNRTMKITLKNDFLSMIVLYVNKSLIVRMEQAEALGRPLL